MLKAPNIALVILLIAAGFLPCSGQLYKMNDGEIYFLSDAKLERIEARSKKLKGLLDVTTNQFAFSIETNTFEGFNSELQKEHFEESYLETNIYPKATFSGKLIDKFNPSLEKQTTRAKGNLEIHGVKKERIIEVQITKSGNGFTINSSFNVLLEDHGIAIPRVVFQKIAPTVAVSVSGLLQSK